MVTLAVTLVALGGGGDNQEIASLCAVIFFCGSVLCERFCGGGRLICQSIACLADFNYVMRSVFWEQLIFALCGSVSLRVAGRGEARRCCCDSD